jgi:hypothetical protein
LVSDETLGGAVIDSTTLRQLFPGEDDVPHPWIAVDSITRDQRSKFLNTRFIF